MVGMEEKCSIVYIRLVTQTNHQFGVLQYIIKTIIHCISTLNTNVYVVYITSYRTQYILSV